MKKSLVSFSGLLSLSFILVFLATPVNAEPYGWSPDVNAGNKDNVLCTGEKPKAPVLYQPNHPAFPQPTGSGQVRVQWTKVPGVTGYHVYYGLSPNNYIYSVRNLNSESESITIGGLGNRSYYFAVQSKKDCATGPLSNEWGGRPGRGGFATALVRSTPVTTTGEKVEAVYPSRNIKQDNAVQVKQTIEPTKQEAPKYDSQKAVPVAPKAVEAAKPAEKRGFLQSIFDAIGNFFK